MVHKSDTVFYTACNIVLHVFKSISGKKSVLKNANARTFPEIYHYHLNQSHQNGMVMVCFSHLKFPSIERCACA